MSPEFAMVEMWSAAVVVCYPHPIPDDRERLAELGARWSPSILDLSHDDAMRWYRTGKEIYELRRRIGATVRTTRPARSRKVP